uniref:Uncharacterized protein n=1 Tax=Solanum lycopersicum TaxID=4081 RepID=A0A3Q7F0L8_SOLLC
MREMKGGVDEGKQSKCCGLSSLAWLRFPPPEIPEKGAWHNDLHDTSHLLNSTKRNYWWLYISKFTNSDISHPWLRVGIQER